MYGLSLMYKCIWQCREGGASLYHNINLNIVFASAHVFAMRARTQIERYTGHFCIHGDCFEPKRKFRTHEKHSRLNIIFHKYLFEFLCVVFLSLFRRD